MQEYKDLEIGFIGQGYIGKNMADDYQARGYSVVRYSLEDEYINNKNKIKACDVVFIAVPTPTTPKGSDYSLVEEAVCLVGVGKIAVIKSTIIPGTTKNIQETYPERIVLFSPEFLSKVSAAHDAKNPICNIIGLVGTDDIYTNAASLVHSTLPESPRTFTVSSQSAEQYKYIHNVHGFMRIVMANLFYDVAQKNDADWEEIRPMMDSNPMMSPYYNQPVHKSGRGAGGCCFIKDYAAFRMMFEEKLTEDTLGIQLLQAFEQKNLSLLKESGKDEENVRNVYLDSDINI